MPCNTNHGAMATNKPQARVLTGVRHRVRPAFSRGRRAKGYAAWCDACVLLRRLPIDAFDNPIQLA